MFFVLTELTFVLMVQQSMVSKTCEALAQIKKYHQTDGILHCHKLTLRGGQRRGEGDRLLKNVLGESVKIVNYIKSQHLSVTFLIACVMKWEV